MVYGSCRTFNPNSPNMRERKCTKKFLKRFQSQTFTSDDRYPKYSRLPSKEAGQICHLRNHEIDEIDNRWMVPYNSLLLKIFDAHIKVELCSSIKSKQYVTKNINKGTDQPTFNIQSPNELEKCRPGR